jgi:autotransporter passenger strand-loop-strand repeat protein
VHLKNGGVASNTVVSSGTTLVVSSGGTADPTVISSGGSETISSGGTDLGALIRPAVRVPALPSGRL